MSKHEDAIRQGAQHLLDPDEEIVAAIVASPRGSSTAMAGGVAVGEIGGRWSGKNANAAANAGLVLERNAGVVLTPTRLLTVALGISFTGGVKEVKGLLSAVPISEISEIKGKWNVLTIKSSGTEFKLEAKPPAVKALTAAFSELKAAA